MVSLRSRMCACLDAARRGWTSLTFWLGLGSLALTGATPGSSTTNAPAPTNVLTQAVQILRLPSGQAARRWPVELRGTITCFDARAQLCFLQDASAGIYIYPMNFGLDLVPGDLVEVAGVSGAGIFSPVVHATNLRRVGSGSLPPAKSVSIEELATGREDSQWVEVEGIVHRAAEDWGHLVLDLVVGGSRLKVRMLSYAPDAKEELTDARVRIQGVAATSYNNKGQLTGFHLFASTMKDITVVEASQGDPFRLRVESSRSLMAYLPGKSAGHRVHLYGTVIGHYANDGLFIKDEGGGIRIDTDQSDPATVPLGTIIDAVGFPARGQYSPILEDANFRIAGKGVCPLPTTVTAEQGASGEFDNELVQLTGELIGHGDESGGREALLIQSNKKTFRAYVTKRDEPQIFNPAPVGSRLRVTGVCSVEGNESGKPRSFSVWLRSANDMEVLAWPAPWKMTQLSWVLGGAGFASLLGAIWVGLMRRRVRAQTEAIRRRERALEVRYRDLFENAKDIIYTHDVGGTLTSLNKAGEQILGITSDEALGTKITDLVAPEQREVFRGHLDRILSGEQDGSFEIELVSKAGRRVVLEVSNRLNYLDGQLIGVQGFARDITGRKETEGALRQSEQQLRKSSEQRERLGRDLHDGIIQSIYAVGLNIEDCRRLMSRQPVEAQKRLEHVLADLNGVIREVRSFILGLESTTLTGQEFRTALKSLTLTLGENKAARFSLEIDPLAAENLTGKQATHLLFIAREAISNSVRHAAADRIVISLKLARGVLRFQVADNGRGFDPSAVSPEGRGLRNLAARAEEIEATFEIDSRPGDGTRIMLDIPSESLHQSLVDEKDSAAHRGRP